jgi:hypothetical protein
MVGSVRMSVGLVILLALGAPAHADKIAVASDRSESAETVKRVLDILLASDSAPPDRRVDVGVVRLTDGTAAGEVSVTAELRLSISDKRGLVSVLTTSSKVSVTSRAYRENRLPGMKREALIAATQAAVPSLRAHLRKPR